MKEIYDNRGNAIYRSYGGFEFWKEYDEDNNEIHCIDSNGFEYWYDYNENGDWTYFKDSGGSEMWFVYDDNNQPTEISQKEFEQIKRDKEQKEFLSREEVSIFELMDI